MDSSIILKNKQTRIIMVLKDTSQNWYLSTLAKNTSTTYVHACNFINRCEALGIVSSEKHGKIKVVKLTEKGLKLAESLSNITALISTTPAPTAPPQEQKP
jgi:predicted transcriptional regulator